MKEIIQIVGICLFAAIVGSNLAAFHYQRKMRNFAKNTSDLVQQVGALEFFLKQQDSRLIETHQIAVRMENILKAIVESSCDDESCRHMNNILNEFSHLKERNDKIIGRLRIKETF